MSSDDAYLDGAAAIGRRVVADAVWHRGRCGWMGAAGWDETRPWRSEYRALGPSFYDGTAGIGLFLARLAVTTGDAEVHRTAVGAMRHALAGARALPAAGPNGFHTGTLGIAVAAVDAATLLYDDELRSGAAMTAALTRSPPTYDRYPDLILGSAGTILGLLALAESFGDDALVHEAVVVGNALIARASRTRHGWAWATPGRRSRHALCGLSHGAAGIGWALLELFAATGDEQFEAGARGAFDYERSWLDRDTGTWPDLRIGGQRRGRTRRVASAAVGTWCHGEGGVGLTRLRAGAVLGDERYRDEAELAFETTRRALARALSYEIADLTLCHGAAGLAEVVLIAHSESEDAPRAATELGSLVLQRYGATGEWPCGAGGGTSPGLFRGLSGIGWWLLRMRDSAMPSPLTMPRMRLTAVRSPA